MIKINIQRFGGRGSSSSGGQGALVFSGQRARGGKRIISASDTKGNDLPAKMNVLTSSRFRSVDSIAKAFGKKTLKALREYSGAIDEQGFVHKFATGGKSSTPHLTIDNGWSIHNHPTFDKNGKTVAWNAFSKQDLVNTAKDTNTRGTIVVANGNRMMYKFEKTKNFNMKKFINEIGKGRAKGKNYDEQVHNWLKQNQKKYGFKYTRTKF